MAKWTIYWNENASDTYLYGSKIQFHAEDDVEFENELMPPGTIMKQWYSKTNYQKQKIEPSLPMIDGESRYHISSDIECEDPKGYMIRLVFYDRYEEEAGSVTLQEKESDFCCPLKTYSYRMQLIHAGASAFRFHSITIREKEDESDK